jgi:hypothetical protein
MCSKFALRLLLLAPFSKLQYDVKDLFGWFPPKYSEGPNNAPYLLHQKEMCICAFILVVLCDAQSTLNSCNPNHSCQVSFTKIKSSIYGKKIHVYFIILHNNSLKYIGDEFF